MTKRLALAVTRKHAAPSLAAPELVDLTWLIRYARHCRLRSDSSESLIASIRHSIGNAAWRILCRSPKTRFLPILRNRELSFESLTTYCQRLAEFKFSTAPRAELLEYFVAQRRAYFNLPCRIPQNDDYLLIRIAEREPILKMSQIALVSNWVDQEHVVLHPRNKWTALVQRALQCRQLKRVELMTQSTKPWHFFCNGTDWRGYHIEPIRNSAELWLEGTALGNCLYKLRYECNALLPSRFFSIRKGGRRYATLELSWTPPREHFVGMDRELGRWEIRDLRLCFNKLPNTHLNEAMKGFAWMYSFWAKRPARMPSGYAQEVRRRINRISQQPGHLPGHLSFPT